MKPTVILRVDASARSAAESYSRQLGDYLLAKLVQQHPQTTILRRDLSKGVLFLTEEQIAGREMLEKDRTAAQQALLKPSDKMIAELRAADVLLLTPPIY
ncbi:MAG: NAD(P)H-dependent oxidoreductase [Cyanobacteria bacterium J06648_16]